MPAPSVKERYDLSWNDLMQAEEEYSVHYRCRIEWGAAWIRYAPKSTRKFLIITCFAISGREGPNRIIGHAACGYRTGRGSSSVPGAYLRSLLDAIDDLEQRRLDPRYNRDTPVAPLPGS